MSEQEKERVKTVPNELLSLEERKVNALENIAESLDLMLEWMEEIDKDGWSNRIQWYLDLFKQKFLDGTYEPEEGDGKRRRR